jgi:hypothetical protein
MRRRIVAVAVLVPDGDVEDAFQQVAHAVLHRGAGGVRLGHHVAALGALAVGRHVDVVVAGVGATRYLGDDADVIRALGRYRRGVADREADGWCRWAQRRVQLAAYVA